MTWPGIRTLAGLGRVRISLAAGLSAMAGYVLAAYRPGPLMLFTGTGVFLLAAGASALNQYQERHTDALMQRTRHRPLPSGTMTVRGVLIFCGICMPAGLLLIFLAGGRAAAGAGIFAVIWYNGLYTNLKRVTAFAALPGALIGALPPLLGWNAAGGRLTDPGLLVLCLFFFLWQVPHFWLTAVRYADQYSYAGLPTPASVFSKRQLSRIVFVWIAAVAVSSLLFVPFGLTLHAPAGYALLIISGLLLLQGVSLITRREITTACGHTLKTLNLYLLAVMALFFADHLLS
ncbi:MAG: UbiA family prenyltransferase [Thermodesulfovibrionales bacterium]